MLPLDKNTYGSNSGENTNLFNSATAMTHEEFMEKLAKLKSEVSYHHQDDNRVVFTSSEERPIQSESVYLVDATIAKLLLAKFLKPTNPL